MKLAVLILISLISYLQGQVYVDFNAAPGGDGQQNNPFSTVAAALNALGPAGGTVRFLPGSGTSSVNVGTGCNNMPCGNILFESESGNPTSVTWTIAISTGVASSSTFTFSGLGLSSNGNNMFRSINPAGSANFVIDNCVVTPVASSTFDFANTSATFMMTNSQLVGTSATPFLRAGQISLTNNVFRQNTPPSFVGAVLALEWTDNIFIDNSCTGTTCFNLPASSQLNGNSFYETAGTDTAFSCAAPVDLSTNSFCGSDGNTISPNCGSFVPLTVPTVCGICTPTGTELTGFDASTQTCFPANGTIVEVVPTTVTVDQAGGGDFISLTAAVAAAQPGTNIILSPGNYNEASISLPPFPLQITGGPGVIVSTPFVFNENGVPPLISRPTIIRDITIQGITNVPFTLIRASPTFQGLFLTQLTTNTIFSLNSASFPLITGCVFTDNNTTNAMISGSGEISAEIIGNGFFANSAGAFNPGGTTTRLIARNNVFSGGLSQDAQIRVSGNADQIQHIDIIDNDFSNNIATLLINPTDLNCANTATTFFLTASGNRFCSSAAQMGQSRVSCSGPNANFGPVNETPFPADMCGACLASTDECTLPTFEECYQVPRPVIDCNGVCGGESVLDAEDDCCLQADFQPPCNECNCSSTDGTDFNSSSASSLIVSFASLSALVLFF